MDKKILISYFSWGGNTKAIAEKIQKQIGGELYRIETVQEYPTDYHATTDVAKKEIQSGVLPALKENKDASEYDIVFIGTPAWWYTYAPALKTFLASNDFEGKTIMPFVTHGGGGGYKIADEIQEIAKGSDVKKQLVIYGKGNDSTDDEIKTWLEQLK